VAERPARRRDLLEVLGERQGDGLLEPREPVGDRACRDLRAAEQGEGDDLDARVLDLPAECQRRLGAPPRGLRVTRGE
jgi:hypothetical protein